MASRALLEPVEAELRLSSAIGASTGVLTNDGAVDERTESNVEIDPRCLPCSAGIVGAKSSAATPAVF